MSERTPAIMAWLFHPAAITRGQRFLEIVCHPADRARTCESQSFRTRSTSKRMRWRTNQASDKFLSYL